MSRAQDRVSPGPVRGLATTHWSVVLAAQRQDSSEAARAMEELCRTYWPALYAYLRREGHEPADAEDLTQAFFERFLEKRFIDDVDRQKGKFRSFLLKALNHFLADEWRRAHTEKRGGRCPVISINAAEWETRYGAELISDQTPAASYERRWALTLFEQALAELRREFSQAGKQSQFELLKEFLSSPTGDGAYDRAAAHLNVDPGAVALLVHRLRKRYGELVRQEVAHTVADPTEVEEEMRHLLAVLSR